MKLLLKKPKVEDTPVEEPKRGRPGKDKEAVKKSPISTDSSDDRRIGRKEFDALAERVLALERLFSESGYVPVPGLIATDDPEKPGKMFIDIDKQLAKGWTEPEMIAAGTYFGLDMTALRGQPREIRRRLHEEMALHGVVMSEA